MNKSNRKSVYFLNFQHSIPNHAPHKQYNYTIAYTHISVPIPLNHISTSRHKRQSHAEIINENGRADGGFSSSVASLSSHSQKRQTNDEPWTPTRLSIKSHQDTRRWTSRSLAFHPDGMCSLKMTLTDFGLFPSISFWQW
jgi:hypothetical protein